MAKMSMAEEIKFLREEVERLKKEDIQNSPEESEEDVSLDALVDGVHDMEADLEEKAHELVERMKLDYDNMSPATAVAIFSAGALFGRIFLSKQGSVMNKELSKKFQLLLRSEKALLKLEMRRKIRQVVYNDPDRHIGHCDF